MADQIVIDPSMDAEEYVQQFSPEEPGPVYHQDEEDFHVSVPEDALSMYLQSFEYDQHRQPRKKDVVF